MRGQGGRARAAAALLTVLVGMASLAPPARAATVLGVGRANMPAVANPALLRDLSAAQQTALARNGFVVGAPSPKQGDTGNLPYYGASGAPSYGHAAYWQFYDLYEENFGRGVPTFLTGDALLHTWHVIYDQTLIVLERQALAPKLARLSEGLVTVAAYQYGASSSPAVKDAARLDLGYAAVAARLLDPRAALPAPVAPVVARELALIRAHRSFAPSPLFEYAVDYSKFVPRGHYAGDATLARYFQAMTWYGLLTFRLNGPDAALRTRQALLFTRALAQKPDLYRLWADVFDPVTAWVGPSDDLTVRDYMGVMARVYAAGAPVAALADDARLARFRALANGLPGPRIDGDLIPPSADVAAGKGLRLFGQRFVPDATAMQALVWDKVGTPVQKRLWPSGLDVAATLGSARASALVSGPGPYNATRYANYAGQLAKARQANRTLPDNLYGGWLDTLRAEWGPVPPGAPAFMKGDAWGDKALATGLGSWAELRHDTLLYVKQTGGGGGGRGPTPIPPAYVEPVPLVYARLSALVGRLKATLIAEGILDSLPQPEAQYPPSVAQTKGERGYRGALDLYAWLVALASRISARELLGQAVSRDDLSAVATSFDQMDTLDNFFRLNAARTAVQPVDMQVAAVADVYTEPTSGLALEEGVGDVLPLYAVVTINGRRWLARGGAYSYYEFRQPMSDRLTDDAWRRLRRRPSLPAWTASYMAY